VSITAQIAFESSFDHIGKMKKMYDAFSVSDQTTEIFNTIDAFHSKLFQAYSLQKNSKIH